jgi:hypothetical protein
LWVREGEERRGLRFELNHLCQIEIERFFVLNDSHMICDVTVRNSSDMILYVQFVCFIYIFEERIHLVIIHAAT